MPLKEELERNRMFRLYKSQLNKRNNDLEELSSQVKKMVRDPIVKEIEQDIKTPPPVEEEEEEIEEQVEVKPKCQVVYVSTPEVQASINKKKERERITVESIASAAAELNETITTDKVVAFPERPKEEMLPTLTIEQAVEKSNSLPTEKKHRHRDKNYQVYDLLHQRLIDVYHQSTYWDDKITPDKLFVNTRNELLILEKYRALMSGVIDKATKKLLDRVLDTQPHKQHWYNKKNKC